MTNKEIDKSSIDINNVYVLCSNVKEKRFVRLDEKTANGMNEYGFHTRYFSSRLIDIFTNEVIFKRDNIYPIKDNVYIENKSIEDSYLAYLKPIREVYEELNYYEDKVLIEILYQLLSLNKENGKVKVKK